MQKTTTRNSFGTERGCEAHNRQDCDRCAFDASVPPGQSGATAARGVFDDPEMDRLLEAAAILVDGMIQLAETVDELNKRLNERTRAATPVQP